MKKLLLLCALSICVCRCANGDFEQIDYYKSDNRDRIMVYVAPTATIEEMKAHARNTMYTERRMTDVFYYRENPGIREYSLTCAPNWRTAFNRAICPGCVLRYQKDVFGHEFFDESPWESHLQAVEEQKLMDMGSRAVSKKRLLRDGQRPSSVTSAVE